MATETEQEEPKTDGAVKKKATRKAAKKTGVKRAVAKKKAVKAAKPAIKKTRIKKKATKTAVKKKVVKKKAAAKAASEVSKSKELRATIAGLREEVKDLTRELKRSAKREKVLSGFSEQRDAAIAKFVKRWDKKTLAAMEKAFKPKRKSRK